MSIPRVDPTFTAVDLKAAADKFIDAGHKYWEACHKSGLVAGAVVWCADGDGYMALFTRGEYRSTLICNIDGLGTSYAFGSTVDPDKGE
jgi:hypothetical protein